jgi:hypothetical protein
MGAGPWGWAGFHAAWRTSKPVVRGLRPGRRRDTHGGSGGVVYQVVKDQGGRTC